ncbi:PAS-domain containing protein [Jannaschia pohangensis]|uniref:PAS domain-containing protein n=1 Tax=Jannaschia pohangensis TaxID=390807 RepID=A0A1I3TYU1_9RHOB|nr:PAS-domain containing protein [Jannaschia pohangensis]SFJ75653.1 PAS domain-containing protein [Jannaschia pohangensis]
MIDTIQLLWPLLAGLATAVIALHLVLWFAPADRPTPQIGEHLSEPRWFTFREGYLTEHSGTVGFLLEDPIDHLKAWDELAEVLTDVNPTIPEAFAALRHMGRPFRLEGLFGVDRILVIGIQEGRDIRITVTAASRQSSSMRVDLASLRAMEEEVDVLSRSNDSSPTLAWVVNPQGDVVWCNDRYLKMVETCSGSEVARGWPIHTLFPTFDAGGQTKFRRKLVCRAGAEHWFEVVVQPADANGLRHLHAQSMNVVIAAEETLRNFIQTLTRSFAFLPNGLAIFDHAGDLVLFNPALIDMTGLDAAWLTRRPKLTEFFDALRQAKRMAEPRDYRAWRDAFVKLGSADDDAAHVETWALPDGRTFRMTGQPQGDGAVTVLLEDITADIEAARRQRADRTILTTVLDTLSEAVIIFDHDGKTIVANDAARDMWFNGAADAILPASLDGCLAFWSALSEPTDAWADLRSFHRDPDKERADWTEALRLQDGRPLDLRISPLAGGRLSLSFQLASRTVHRQSPHGPQQALRA